MCASPHAPKASAEGGGVAFPAVGAVSCGAFVWPAADTAAATTTPATTSPSAPTAAPTGTRGGAQGTLLLELALVFGGGGGMGAKRRQVVATNGYWLSDKEWVEGGASGGTTKTGGVNDGAGSTGLPALAPDYADLWALRQASVFLLRLTKVSC